MQIGDARVDMRVERVARVRRRGREVGPALRMRVPSSAQKPATEHRGGRSRVADGLVVFGRHVLWQPEPSDRPDALHFRRTWSQHLSTLQHGAVAWLTCTPGIEASLSSPTSSPT